MRLHFRYVAIALISMVVLPVAGQADAVRLVEPAALQKLLPVVEGWTSGVVRSDRIVLSPEAGYTFANVSLTSGDSRAKVQISDTGGSPDSLTALAMIVISMPPDFHADVDGATIRRMKFGEMPAAEIWSDGKHTGEITAVVAGRFVVSVESSYAESLETLRGLFVRIDLKAVDALK
jgi:hypothetical protein